MINSSMRVLYFITLLALVSGCAASPNLVRYQGMPPYIETATSFIGKHERKDRKELRELLKIDPVRTEWCAAFVNKILEEHRIPGSDYYHENPLMARSFLAWGESVDIPRPGDVVVFPRGDQGWQGHVGFYVGTETKDNIEYYVILGGNQNDEVNLQYFPANKAIGIRRMPIYKEATWQENVLNFLDNRG